MLKLISHVTTCTYSTCVTLITHLLAMRRPHKSGRFALASIISLRTQIFSPQGKILMRLLPNNDPWVWGSAPQSSKFCFAHGPQFPPPILLVLEPSFCAGLETAHPDWKSRGRPQEKNLEDWNGSFAVMRIFPAHARSEILCLIYISQVYSECCCIRSEFFAFLLMFVFFF